MESSKPTLPSPNDMEGIYYYFKKKDKASISPSTKQYVLALLNDTQFDYNNPTYNRIVREINRLDLLKDLDILKIIAEHPYSRAVGFHPDAPYSIFPFWNITLEKKRYKELFEGEWEKRYYKYIQNEYFHNEIEKDFAFDLLTFSQVDFHLTKKYEKIGYLEGEISDLQSSISLLEDEIKEINQNTPVIYKTIREERASDKEAAIAIGSGMGTYGGILGLTAGTSYGVLGTFAVASGVGIGTATLGGGAFALHSYYKKNWASPILLEYKEINVPFIEAKADYSAGKLEIIESKGDQGCYQARFFPQVFAYSKIIVDFVVKKKDLPWNSKRIKLATDELKQANISLKRKQETHALLWKEKDYLVKKKIEKERFGSHRRGNITHIKLTDKVCDGMVPPVIADELGKLSLRHKSSTSDAQKAVVNDTLERLNKKKSVSSTSAIQLKFDTEQKNIDFKNDSVSLQDVSITISDDWLSVDIHSKRATIIEDPSKPQENVNDSEPLSKSVDVPIPDDWLSIDIYSDGTTIIGDPSRLQEKVSLEPIETETSYSPPSPWR